MSFCSCHTTGSYGCPEHEPEPRRYPCAECVELGCGSNGEPCGCDCRHDAAPHLREAKASAPTIRYGCHECLQGHDETRMDVAACPYCGGLTEPMPADEQPTIEARKAVAWAAAREHAADCESNVGFYALGIPAPWTCSAAPDEPSDGYDLKGGRLP